MSASDLERELRSAGDKVSEGRFRIDGKRALDRLKDHRLADPSHWILELLRSAALSGAKKVEITTDADDVEVQVAGVSFPEAVMKDLLSRALMGGATVETRRARLLGLSVAGALGVSPKWIHVESGGVRVELTPPDVMRLGEGRKNGLTLSLRKRLSVKVAAALVRGAPEAAAVLERCRRFDCPVTVNGKAAVKAEPWDVPLADSETRKLGPVTVTVGLPKKPLEVSELTLDILGVVVARRLVPQPGLQVLAWLRGDGMRTNASGSDVVDTDEDFQRARQAVEDLSLELLARRVKELEASGDAKLRELLLAMLLSTATDKRARALLEKAPLLPGPAGERYSVAAFKAEAEAGRPIYVAHASYARGSYPEPTLLYPSAWKSLVPKARFVDVREHVRRTQRAAENKAQWEGQPEEEAKLREAAWVARAPVKGGSLEGEVGLDAANHGAFVRLLLKGRFLQQGEVASLAPLRIFAVVNLQKEIALKDWDEVPNKKLWGQVTDAVERAAAKALDAALSRSDLSDPVLAHAKDRLLRLARRQEHDVPAPLAAARVFSLLGGGSISVAELRKEKQWRYVNQPWPHALLSGEPVVQLKDKDSWEIFKELGDNKLQHVQRQLVFERELRNRLDGPKERPVVKDKLVATRIDTPGLEGEVAITTGQGSQAELRLYREGFLLETTTEPATYGAVVAAVECPALTSEPTWTRAVRDEAYEKTVAAVRAAERQLPVAIVAKYPVATDVPASLRRQLLRFLTLELGPDAPRERSPEAEAVEARLVFETSRGPRTLAELRALGAATGKLHVASPPLSLGIPEELFVVCADKGLAEQLERILGVETVDAQPEIARMIARRAFLDRSPHSGVLDPSAQPRAAASTPGVELEAGVTGKGPSATVDVLVEGRLFCTERFATHLSLHGIARLEGADLATRELTAEQRTSLADAVREAERKIIGEALDLYEVEAMAGELAGLRELLFTAVRERFDELEGPIADRLRRAPLLPCSDGKLRALADLPRGKALLFTTAKFDAELPTRGPVVLAADPAMRELIERWPERENVTQQLRSQAEARAYRARLTRVKVVQLGGDLKWRRPVSTALLEGEVAVVDSSPGRVEVLMDRKPLCTVNGVLPPPLAAAVNCDTLTPELGHVGVVKNDTWEHLLEQLLKAGGELAAVVAGDWPALSEADRLATRGQVVRLAFWAADKLKDHPLETVPLLITTEGEPLSIADLRAERKKRKEVMFAERGGSLLKESRWVWRPRAGELDAARPLDLKLKNATGALEHADRVRSRPRVSQLRAEDPSIWREPVHAKKTTGELALPALPSNHLFVDVLRQMTKLETYDTPHPVGAVVQVSCEALTPNADWTKAVRNRAFRELLAAIDDTLEKALVRRLVEGPRDGDWRAYAAAAARWERSRSGPLAEALAGLPLFLDLAGKPVTAGAVLAEQSRTRRVAIATKGAAPEGTLVLLDTEVTRALLGALKATPEDVTSEINRAEELKAARRARRLQAMTWSGRALVRMAVSHDGLSGELALPASTDGMQELRLAKEGIDVGPWDAQTPSGVCGVLAVADLVVDEEWESFSLTSAQRTAVRGVIDDLYGELARRADGFDAEQRALAAWHALRFAADHGVTSPQHLARLKGPAAALAQACLFPSLEGRWISLRAVGDEALSRGRVAVLQKRIFTPDVGDALVLEAPSLDAPWVKLLEAVLGKGAVDRVTDVKAWRQRRAEDDPPEGSAALAGLVRLRKESRLLRAGALGHLSPDDLSELRTNRGDGSVPVRYDVKRKVALLDLKHAGVKRALEGHAVRPERLYLLLAAVYGAVNRALESVTDEHEASLLLGLAGSLAANPRLLDRSAGAPDDPPPAG